MSKLTHPTLAIVAVAGLSAGCASTVPVTADSLTFHADARWRREVPHHDTRRLQFRIPSQRQGVEDARLVVWNIETLRDAGDGLTVQANIHRWMDQFVQDDGSPSGTNVRQTEYRVNDMPVHIVDISGRYVPKAPGPGDIRLKHAGYRMLGAYINAPHGDYIVKLWGPAPVVADNVDAFKTFVLSVRSGATAWPAEPEPLSDQPKSALTAFKNVP